MQALSLSFLLSLETIVCVTPFIYFWIFISHNTLVNIKGSSGSVEFDHENQELDLVVQKDSFDENSQQKDVKALSGGEKSFTWDLQNLNCICINLRNLSNSIFFFFRSFIYFSLKTNIYTHTVQLLSY